VLTDSYKQFHEHLNDDNTQVFFGKFGQKFEDNDVYSGFYAYNDSTRNMMFFRENSEEVSSYSLHSYMNLLPNKAKELKDNHSLKVFFHF